MLFLKSVYLFLSHIQQRKYTILRQASYNNGTLINVELTTGKLIGLLHFMSSICSCNCFHMLNYFHCGMWWCFVLYFVRSIICLFFWVFFSMECFVCAWVCVCVCVCVFIMLNKHCKIIYTEFQLWCRHCILL